MLRSRQAQRARGLGYNVGTASRTRFCKTALRAISYTVLSSIVALLLAYWPASARDVLAKLSAVRAELTVQTVDRAHKTDRLPQVSFERRWSAAPAQSNPIRGDSGQRKQPQAERRIEKIPFSCELAFSRVVTKGNFSTRCMARAHESATVALG